MGNTKESIDKELIEDTEIKKYALLVKQADDERDIALAESRKLTSENAELILNVRNKDDQISALTIERDALKNRVDLQTAELVKLRGRSGDVEVEILGDVSQYGVKEDGVVVTIMPLRPSYLQDGTIWTPFRLPKSVIAQWDAYNSFIDEKGHPQSHKRIYRLVKV